MITYNKWDKIGHGTIKCNAEECFLSLQVSLWLKPKRKPIYIT